MELSKTQKIKYRALLFLLFLGVVLFVFLNIPINKLSGFINNSFVTNTELNYVKSNNYFGPFIKIEVIDENKITVDNLAKDDEKANSVYEIKFKLFDLIPIKTKKINIIKENKVILGGNTIGLVLKMDGVLIVGSSPVVTDDGEVDMLEANNLKVGDTIFQIEDETINDISSISKIVNKEENKNKELRIKGKRNGVDFETKIKPLYDLNSKDYKLGFWVRDDASGIGTLTYINSKNRFGALGHPICDSDTKSIISVKEGKLYNCSVLGVEKGVSGDPGELKGMFMQGKNEQGVVEKNNNYGVFGFVNNESGFLKNYEEVEAGSRIFVKPGKAKIRCCLDGTNLETFDIEIIKTNYQNFSNSKSMVVRVTDKNLIERTGGIVQGMSGSPIIQDGKLIGAITHVFVNDPTKGFGVYIDWMLEQ